MPRAINRSVLLPMMTLFLPAALAAVPPGQTVPSIFPLLSDKECWGKLSTGRERRSPAAAVVGTGDGWSDAPDDGRNAATGFLAPDT